MHNPAIASLRTVFISAALMSFSVQAWSDADAGIREYDKGNYASAMQLTKPLAEAGDAEAELLMGTMYANGKGVPKDDTQAAAWYWRAAEAGNAKAQLTLSGIYADGRGVSKNDDLSNYWRWKVATAFAGGEKEKLETAIIRQKGPDAAVMKYVGAEIDMDHCKAPTYKRTGYGYHVSGEMQLLFLVGEDGKVLEASILDKSDWPALDTAFLKSFARSCTFTPATNKRKPVRSLYKLQVGWSVDP